MEENNLISKDKQLLLDLQVSESNYKFNTTFSDEISKTENELLHINENLTSIQNLQPNCDKLDYILAACSGALCGIIDIFLVRTPENSPLGKITDQWIADRIIDFANINSGQYFDSLDSAIRFLEKKYKVPYDQNGLGDAGKTVFELNAKNHHFKSLAHNPNLLGLFFSLLDQFTNSSHFVTDGELISLQKADLNWELKGNSIPSKLFCGFENWFGHLLSDMAGSSNSAKYGKRGMGIPSPLWTWINGAIAIKRSLGLNASELEKTINTIAIKIYQKGYDIRFETAKTIPVILNELLVRFIYSLRRLFNYFSISQNKEHTFRSVWEKCEPFSNSSVKRMLTVAHGVFCLINIGESVEKAYTSKDTLEFFLRLNLPGLGRFTISLYGEAKCQINYNQEKNASEWLKKEKVILDNYLNGLRELSSHYDDNYLITFVDDFQTSNAYMQAFNKSANLAKIRNVPEDRILKKKTDIDNYFRRN